MDVLPCGNIFFRDVFNDNQVDDKILFFIIDRYIRDSRNKKIVMVLFQKREILIGL